MERLIDPAQLSGDGLERLCRICFVGGPAVPKDA